VVNRTWGLVGLLAATATSSYLARVNVSVAGALMMKELGLSQPAMGSIFSAFLLGYALFQVPSGMLADRIGAARVLGLAALSWVAATLLITATAAIYPALLVARFLLGVGEAPTFPAAAQAISNWVPPHRRGRASGIAMSAVGLGSAIAPPLLTFVMSRWGWRAALLASAIPALSVGLAWLVVRTPPVAPAAAARPISLKGLPRSRSFILLTISYTLQGYVGYIFVFWFYLYLVEVRHFSLLRSALLGSLPWILSVISIPLGGFLYDRHRSLRRVIPAVGLGGAGVFTAVGAHADNPYVAAVALALATGLVLCVEGPFWATMTQIAGERSGAAGGVMNMGSNVGGLVSPWLTPVLAASLGWESALFVSAGLALVGSALWWWIRPDEDAALLAADAPVAAAYKGHQV
jgi:MFS transporter, ACS family, glucarate transporter